MAPVAKGNLFVAENGPSHAYGDLLEMSATPITGGDTCNGSLVHRVIASVYFSHAAAGSYSTGVDPYVDVVLAQTTLLVNKATLNSLHVEEMLSAVQLVQTLGGGWDRTQLPTPARVSTKPLAADYELQQ